MKKNELVVKFSNQNAFGAFCEALADDHVAFSLVGFQTVVVKETDVSNLPSQSRSVLETYRSRQVAELLTSVPRGKRKLTTPEEASRLFREFSQKYI